jgi:probable F420-dependent oxidoreductase
MKVRFGFTCRGQAELALDDFPRLVDDLERLGFDSLWLPELMLNGPFDPLVGLAYAAARTTRLKLGAYLIVPGRNPVRLARELANLDRLSGGRLLLIMVLGQPDAPELLAQHVTKAERGALLDEVLPLLRRLWSGDVVNHHGPCYQLRDARLSPTPVQVPLEMWLGGQVPEALRRAGRLGDGWIPGLITPTEAAEKRRRIEAAAAEAGRTIDPEHFGVNLTYSRGALPMPVVEQLRRRRPDLDPADLIPQSRTALHARVDEWLAVGFSKFLLRPVVPPTDWTAELETLAADIMERQT